MKAWMILPIVALLSTPARADNIAQFNAPMAPHSMPAPIYTPPKTGNIAQYNAPGAVGGATYGTNGHGGYNYQPGTNPSPSIGERLNAPGNGPDSGKTIGQRLNVPGYERWSE